MKNKGNYYALYVADEDTVLSNPDQIGEYTLVGNRKGTALNISGNAVDLTDSESSFAENTPGIPSGSVSGTFNTDHAEDAGEKILRTAVKTQEQVKWLYTRVDVAGVPVAGMIQHRGTGTVNSVNYTNAHEGASELAVDITISGQFTTENIPT